jgi:uncharacterized protein YndB with AHSA1/START domain
MTRKNVIHSTFTLERVYEKASPQRVFAAFSNKATKRRWFVEGEGWDILSFDMDFRVGGLEQSRFRFQGGPEIRNDAVYQDIVPNERIVLAYSMSAEGKCFSASLATLEFQPAEGGTRLVFTEQGAYLDGNPDAPKNREAGTRELLEALAGELKKNG